MQFTQYISNDGDTVTTLLPVSPNVSRIYLIAISDPFVATTFSYWAPIKFAYLFKNLSGSGYIAKNSGVISLRTLSTKSLGSPSGFSFISYLKQLYLFCLGKTLTVFLIFSLT